VGRSAITNGSGLPARNLRARVSSVLPAGALNPTNEGPERRQELKMNRRSPVSPPMSEVRRKVIVATLLLGFAVSAYYLGAPPPAQGVSSGIVISQIYGGGGNAGAAFKNDFIELFNRGASPVTVTGWTVQYAASTGTTWQATSLSGTIAPGKYYQVQE